MLSRRSLPHGTGVPSVLLCSHPLRGAVGGCHADEEDAVKRIQRQRTKGWRMPEGAVYVGRPSVWGNPFDAALLGNQGAVNAYLVHLSSYFGWESRMLRRAFRPLPVESTALREWIAPLRGKDLACWCPLDQPCHADILLELAATPTRRGK
jgi:hypothetical protein